MRAPIAAFARVARRAAPWALAACALAFLPPARAADDAGRAPILIAGDARVAEQADAYGRARDLLRTLRGRVAPDADLELALALDEARTGQLDSAAARLSTPMMDAALVDSMPIQRRQDYPWQREPAWLDGRFTGWNWYVARARAEVFAALHRWPAAREAARHAVEARPFSGKEWLALAICAGQTGDTALAGRAARTAAALDPTLPEAQYVVGLVDWREGDRHEAQARFRAAVALDSTYREPALALVHMMLPGPPHSFPATFLTGIRQVGLLTSPLGPKLEEFHQMDVPATITHREPVILPDSIRARLEEPVDLIVPVLLDKHGHAVLNELPWFSPEKLPPAAAVAFISTLPRWTFSPARRLDENRRVWVTVDQNFKP